jgi:hypothetical protein
LALLMNYVQRRSFLPCIVACGHVSLTYVLSVNWHRPCRMGVCYMPFRSSVCHSSLVSISTDCTLSDLCCEHRFLLLTGTYLPWRAKWHHRHVSSCPLCPCLTVRSSQPGSKVSCMALWPRAFFLNCGMQIRVKNT